MQYFEPRFVGEALVVLERYGAGAKILAGGTLLAARLRESPAGLDAIVNLKRIAELGAIGRDGDGLRVGALATADELARLPLVKECAPLLSAAAASLGARQLRSSATIGGNVCSGLANADLSTALVALDASVVVEIGGGHRHDIPIADFLAGVADGSSRGSLVVAIDVPVPDRRWAFVKMQTRRSFEMAIVSVAISGMRVALGGVARSPVLAAGASRVLARGPLTRELAREAARAAAQIDSQPADDAHASARYRRALVETLVYHALTQTESYCGDGWTSTR